MDYVIMDISCCWYIVLEYEDRVGERERERCRKLHIFHKLLRLTRRIVCNKYYNLVYKKFTMYNNHHFSNLTSVRAYISTRFMNFIINGYKIIIICTLDLQLQCFNLLSLLLGSIGKYLY